MTVDTRETLSRVLVIERKIKASEERLAKLDKEIAERREAVQGRLETEKDIADEVIAELKAVAALSRRATKARKRSAELREERAELAQAWATAVE